MLLLNRFKLKEFFFMTISIPPRVETIGTECYMGVAMFLSMLERPLITLRFHCYYITIVIKCDCQDA